MQAFACSTGAVDVRRVLMQVKELALQVLPVEFVAASAEPAPAEEALPVLETRQVRSWLTSCAQVEKQIDAQLRRGRAAHPNLPLCALCSVLAQLALHHRVDWCIDHIPAMEEDLMIRF